MRDTALATLTLLFTDIEGSSQLLEREGERYPAALERHYAILRGAIVKRGGEIVVTTGDGLFATFTGASDAIHAALDAQRLIRGEAWAIGPFRVRMALHTGAVQRRGDDLIGEAIHRCARLAALGHGEQVLVSATTAALARGGLPDGARLLDLGRVALRGLTDPEQVFQLLHPDLPSKFPSLRAAMLAAHDLPVSATPLLGRDRELATAVAALLGPSVRLVTVTGPGGAGKTRLAIEVASRVADRFRDGATFVELAAISDPALVPLTIARSLAIKETSGQPLLDSITKTLRAAERLLVLDNFEQVLEAAGLVADLLTACPALKVVATSRAPLRLASELELHVPPLGLPAQSGQSLEAVGASAAVRLFVDRARAVRPDFALTQDNAAAVAEICARVDALPLAIELAATRVRVLSPRELARRLDQRLPVLTGGARDLPARQRTLRDAIGWSYELLPEPERWLFRRLSVFAGGWTLEAAERICGDGAPLLILDGIGALVEHSLARRADRELDGERFSMLATIREYAHEMLAARGEAGDADASHARYYLELAESTEPLLETAAQARAIHTLEDEREELRVALHRYVASGDTERATRLAGALGWSWWLRGQLTEARASLERVLVLPGAEARTWWRAKSLHAAGMIGFQQKDIPAARGWLEAALAIRRELGDEGGVANTLHFLADVTRIDRGPAEARKLYEEGETLALSTGTYVTLAAHRFHLALDAHAGGRLGARTMIEETLPLVRRLGNPWAISTLLIGLAVIDTEEGAPERALDLLREALVLLRDIGDRFILLFGLATAAAACAGIGERERAVRLAAAAAVHSERNGSTIIGPEGAPIWRAIDEARASLPPGAAERAHAAGRAWSIEAAISEVLAESVR